MPRRLDRHELVILALDDIYRHEGLRYGDPILLGDDILGALCSVFFMDRANCFELLLRASRVSSIVAWQDTLSGPSVSLTRQYSVRDV